MSVSQEIDKKVFCFFTIIIIVLVYGTGIVSDDITEIAIRRGMSDIWEHFIPRGNFVNIPVFNLTHMWVYSLIDIDNLLLLDILKVGYAILSLYMVARFFSLFIDGYSSLVTSFLFLFFPTRESTTYCLMGSHMAFSMYCYLFAYYLIHKDCLKRAASVAFLASFIFTPSISNIIRPGFTLQAQNSLAPFPLPILTSAGFFETGILGKILIHILPALFKCLVIALRADSI